MRNGHCLWRSPTLCSVFSPRSWFQYSSRQFCHSLLRYMQTNGPQRGISGWQNITYAHPFSSYLCIKEKINKQNQGDKERNVMEPPGFLRNYWTIHVRSWRWCWEEGDFPVDTFLHLWTCWKIIHMFPMKSLTVKNAGGNSCRRLIYLKAI